jgi:hypothetical protein
MFVSNDVIKWKQLKHIMSIVKALHLDQYKIVEL